MCTIGDEQIRSQNIFWAAGVQAKPNKRAPFRYFDEGSLATIGRARAVGEVFDVKVYGFIAWLLWEMCSDL